MRKKFSIILAVVIATLCFMPTISFADHGVYDTAKELSDSQIKILDNNLNTFNSNGFDLEIYLADDPEFDANAYADQQSGLNGGILYFNEATKKFTYAPYDKAKDKFTSDICAQIAAVAEEKYSSVGIYEACQSAVVNVENVNYSGELYEGTYYMPSLYDGAEYLTDSEVAAVEERLDSIREKYGVDVALFTEDGMTSSTAEASADDIYDYYFYGAGEDDSGIMLYVCKSERDYWFTTHAEGQSIFNDSVIDDLCDVVVPYLSNDDYYGAFMAYADSAEAVLSGGSVPSVPKNYALITLEALGIGILIALIGAFIMTSARKREMDTALEAADANEYVKEGSMVLTGQRDIFLFSNIVRTKKPEKDSSHTSSSGRSHGGGGGSF